jgi:hypothetical protein
MPVFIYGAGRLFKKGRAFEKDLSVFKSELMESLKAYQKDHFIQGNVKKR